MKTQDIIVGRYYKHSSLLGYIWLGVGMRKMWEEKFTNEANFVYKHLALVHCPNPEYIGLLAQEGDNCQDGFWDEFEILPENFKV